VVGAFRAQHQVSGRASASARDRFGRRRRALRPLRRSAMHNGPLPSSPSSR